MTNTFDHTEREAAGVALRKGETTVAVARSLLAICDTLTAIYDLLTELRDVRDEVTASVDDVELPDDAPAPVAPPAKKAAAPKGRK